MDLVLSVAKEFSPTPGPRDESEGEFSGNAFLRQLLLPRFDEAAAHGEGLLVDLDGTQGYATSFLEAAFGGLARLRGASAVRRVVKLRSEDEPFLVDEIWGYVEDVANREAAQA